MERFANDTLRREIYINEIVFNSRCEATLYGFVMLRGAFMEKTFVITKHALYTLLQHNWRVGYEILQRIDTLFLYNHAVPATLNLIEIFGTTQPLEAAEIKLSAINEYKQQVLFIDQVI